VNQVAAGVVSQGLSIYEALRHSVATTRAALPETPGAPGAPGSNGKDEKAVAPPSPA
jgi:hypothetical protein